MSLNKISLRGRPVIAILSSGSLKVEDISVAVYGEEAINLWRGANILACENRLRDFKL